MGKNKGKGKSKNTNRTPCRNWQQSGSCSYGNSCKFLHPGKGGGSGGGGGAKLCNNIAQGKHCPYGNKCKFSHARGGGGGDISMGGGGNNYNNNNNYNNYNNNNRGGGGMQLDMGMGGGGGGKKKNEACRNYKKGKCNRGANCHYIHEDGGMGGMSMGGGGMMGGGGGMMGGGGVGMAGGMGAGYAGASSVIPLPDFSGGGGGGLSGGMGAGPAAAAGAVGGAAAAEVWGGDNFVTGVATSFLEHYYGKIDSNPSELGNLYLDCSMLTYNGEQFSGLQAIGQRITTPLVQGQEVRTYVPKFDAQPVAPQNILVIAIGTKTITATGAVANFSETFQLAPLQDPSLYYIHNQVFKMVM